MHENQTRVVEIKVACSNQLPTHTKQAIIKHSQVTDTGILCIIHGTTIDNLTVVGITLQHIGTGNNSTEVGETTTIGITQQIHLDGIITIQVTAIGVQRSIELYCTCIIAWHTIVDIKFHAITAGNLTTRHDNETSTV